MERVRVIVAAGCVIAGVAIVPTHPGLAAPPVQAQSVAAATTLAVITTITVGSNPDGVAVNDADDTVYVTNFGSGNVSVINGRTGTVAGTITVGSGPIGVAVDQGDDTVYVANFSDDTVSVINGRTGTVDDTITVGDSPRGVAVDQGDDTVYVTNQVSNTVSVINGRTRTVAGTITVGSSPNGVAVDDSGTNAGLVYVANQGGNTVSVIGRVTPLLGSASGPAGSTATVTLDVPQVDYDVDGSTVTSVSFGGTLATGLTPGVGDAWTLTVPAGSGTVPVTVTFNGGLTASAGSFTYPPPPPPVFPPSAPRDVVGVPGDREAGLSWTAPTSSGSFPISTYQAVVSPGGQSCLVAVPAVTCTISGLTNGTAYTATVRALNGAGWGPYSTASAAFTPLPSVTPSITITGTRAQVRGKPGVAVTGTTTGFDTGAILRPWIRFPGQTSYTQGTASILVDAQGGFTWERRTGKTIYIVIRSEDGTVESNRLVLRTT